MNVLDFDIGNSRIKWRLLDSEQNRSLAEATVQDVQELLNSKLLDLSPALIRAANVRADDSLERLTRICLDQWQLQPFIATVTRDCGGVQNGYRDLSRMGVDRWLAMLAAYTEFQSACLVVDGGTALTLDLVDSNGRHLGGYILPGLNLMASALQANTGIRLRETQEMATTEPGLVTEEAVRNGCLGSVVALIEKCLRLMQRDGDDLVLVLGGGDAGILQDALQNEGVQSVALRPNLVLDGLAVACPVQEA